MDGQLPIAETLITQLLALTDGKEPADSKVCEVTVTQGILDYIFNQSLKGDTYIFMSSDYAKEKAFAQSTNNESVENTMKAATDLVNAYLGTNRVHFETFDNLDGLKALASRLCDGDHLYIAVHGYIYDNITATILGVDIFKVVGPTARVRGANGRTYPQADGMTERDIIGLFSNRQLAKISVFGCSNTIGKTSWMHVLGAVYGQYDLIYKIPLYWPKGDH
jgi:hypothetical protein